MSKYLIKVDYIELKSWTTLSILAQGLKVLILRKNYDIILTTTGTGLFLALLRFLLPWKKPFISEILWQVDANNKYAESIFDKLLKTTLRLNVDRIICVASSQEKSFSKSLRIPEKRIEYVPFGIDSVFFTPEENLPTVNSKIILFVGDAFRDELTLVRAIRNLPVKLVRVSDDHRIAEIYRQMKVESNSVALQNMVILTGISDLRLRQLYAESTIVVVPIISNCKEPAGLTSLLEAMSMGKTVIVTNGLNSEDYVVADKTGIIVEAMNPENMRKAIVKLLENDSERIRIGNCARQSVEENFNFERNVEKLAACFKKLYSES